MWKLAAWGALAKAALATSVAAAAIASPPDLYPVEETLPQVLTISSKSPYMPRRRKPPREALFLSVLLLVSCTALILFISNCARYIKNGGKLRGRDTLTRSLAVDGSGADCRGGEGGGEGSSIFGAAEAQLKILTIPPAVSSCLKPEDAKKVSQAQRRLFTEVATFTYNRNEWKKLSDQATKATDDAARKHLQEEIERLEQDIQQRQDTLKSMGYIEHQKLRELVMLAESSAQGRQLSLAAAAALVATARVTNPLDPLPTAVTPQERATVKRFVKGLVDKGNVFSSGVESGATPPQPSVVSARALLKTGREVVLLLRAAGMKKKEKRLEEMCNRLSSNLEPTGAEGESSLERTPSMSSVSSTLARLSMTIRRRSMVSLSRLLPGRRSFYELDQPLADPDAATAVAFRPSPTPATSPPATPPSVHSARSLAPAGPQELREVNKWIAGAKKHLETGTPAATPADLKALQNMLEEGRRHLKEVEKLTFEPRSSEEFAKEEALVQCKHLLLEIHYFHYPAWMKHISESQQNLKERRQLLIDAVLDTSPESAPPADSSVLQNMLQLRASIVSSSNFVAYLKPLLTAPETPRHLLLTAAEKLENSAEDADNVLQTVGARVAEAWTIRLPAPTLSPEPQVEPQSDPLKQERERQPPHASPVVSVEAETEDTAADSDVPLSPSATSQPSVGSSESLTAPPPPPPSLTSRPSVGSSESLTAPPPPPPSLTSQSSVGSSESLTPPPTPAPSLASQPSFETPDSPMLSPTSKSQPFFDTADSAKPRPSVTSQPSVDSTEYPMSHHSSTSEPSVDSTGYVQPHPSVTSQPSVDSTDSALSHHSVTFEPSVDSTASVGSHSDLFPFPIESPTGKAEAVLQTLLQAGCNTQEVADLQAFINAAGATGTSWSN